MKKTNLLKMSWLAMLISSLSLPWSGINYIIRAGAIGITLLTVLLCFSRDKIVFYKKDKFCLAFIIYLLVACLSVVVSVDKVATVLKALELACDFFLLYVIYWYEKKDYKKYTISNCLFDWNKIVLFVLFIIWCGYFIAPSLFSSPSRGLISKQLGANMLISSNAIGCTAAALIARYLTNKNIKFRIPILILMLVTVVFSMSRTSIIIVASVLFTYVLISKFRISYLILGIGSIVALYYNYDFLMSFIMRGQSVNDFSSLSGRTLMWDQVLQLVKSSPILGYGFGSGSSLITLDEVQMTSVHNGFFEVLLDMGFLGVSVLVVIIISSGFLTIKRVLRCGFENAQYSVLIHIYMIIRTIFSLGLGGWHTLDMMLFLAIVFEDMLAINNSRRPQWKTNL